MPRTRALIVLVMAAVPAAASADSYTIDPSHTYPRWAASHFGFSTYRGQFDRTTGKLTLDPAAGAGSVEITVDATSINTGHAKMNEHLKSADFFDVGKFPAVTFRSTAMTFEGGKPVSASGDFTMLGVTRPMTLRISQVKCGVHPIAKRDACGAEVTGSVKRSDFGMKYGIPGISDVIELTIQIEARKD